MYFQSFSEPLLYRILRMMIRPFRDKDTKWTRL